MTSVTGCLVADVEMYNERVLGHMSEGMGTGLATLSL